MRPISKIKSLFAHRSATIRLALSYLTIIMMLSVGFSGALYGVASHELDKQLAPPTVRQDVSHEQRQNFSVNNSGPQGTAAQAEERVVEGRRALIYELSLLNIGTLAGGAILSYYLARRTLRPIEAAMEAQADFASEASHELRTPLAVLQSENEGALRTLALSPAARTVLRSNLEEIHQLRNLTENLLRLANDTETISLQPTWADDIIQLAQRRVAKRATEKGMTLRQSVPHRQVAAHDQTLIQALVIVLNNAITYSPPRTTVSITGAIDMRSKSLSLSVQDEGPGIAAADLPRIFDRFYRVKWSRREHPAGHGLGLSVARKLVARQHGTITVASTPGKGATFTIRLPLA